MHKDQLNADLLALLEDSELLVPYYRLKEAGVEVAVTSPSRGAIKGKHDYAVDVDKTLDEVNPDDYAILVLPGGAARHWREKSRRRWSWSGVFFSQQTGCRHLPTGRRS